MGDEAADGTKVGTKLLFLVAIIGLVITVFLLGKNLLNKGTDAMESSVKAIDDSRFTDYDKKTVRGRAVKNAIDTFGNEEVAILIKTLESSKTTNVSEISQYSNKGLTVKVKRGTNDGAPSTFISYGAQLDIKPGGSITMEKGTVLAEESFKTDDGGNIIYNSDTTLLSMRGDMMYIADTARFKANLIKNSSKEIVGIVFEQIKLN